MVYPCVVMGCKNIGTHCFPKAETRKMQWMEVIKYNKPIRKSLRICSSHFRRTDFAITPTSFTKLDRANKILKKNAIPSIFPWNQATATPTESYQEQHSSSQSSIFDVTKAQKTYSRTPPIKFVEMPPSFDTHMQENTGEDPLQLFNQEIEFQEEETIMLHQETVFQQETLQDIEKDQPQALYLDHEIQSITEIETVTKSVQTQTQDSKVLITQKNDVTVQTETQVNDTSGFSIYNYKDDERFLHFYTGLENFKKIMLVFYSLGSAVYNLNYFYGTPPKRIDTLEQFFITLIILRRHKTFQEVTMLFRITLKDVYSIFITWIRCMSLQWKNLDLWVDKEHVKAYFPFDFHEKYPATRVVLDATECPIKKPKLPLAQQITFSSYKNRNTIKVLIGITPGGLISYVSPSYGGSATDRQIIERSTILNKFDYNDEIMVDKGLNVQDIFVSHGVKVNMPAFFRKGNQIGSEALSSNRKVASKRVHIERVIGSLKTYKILTEPMNQTEILLSSDIIFVIAMLVNFRSNIINKNS